MVNQDTVMFRIFSDTFKDRESTEAQRKRYMNFIAQEYLEYPWHDESFNLKFEQVGLEHCLLTGSTHFGECIDDEWFIIWLIMKLTIFDDSLRIQVFDDDGQFLLAEASNVIPNWLNPDTSNNRVWIQQGHLQIIIEKQNEDISISEALKILEQSGGILDSEELQIAPQSRLSKYMHGFRSITHTSQVIVPYTVAVLLSQPGCSRLIGSAVTALAATRYDPMKLRRMNRLLNNGATFFVQSCHDSGSISTPVTDSCFWPKLKQISTEYFRFSCTFSRFQFARLCSLALPSGIQRPSAPESSLDRASVDLGMKLSVGLELLLTDSMNSFGRFIPDRGSAFIGKSGEYWKRFLFSLNEGGYFRGELEGSRLYGELFANAKEYFFENLLDRPVSSDDVALSNIAVDHGQLLRQTLDDMERNPSKLITADELHTESRNLQPADDDSWMFITPEELDLMLIGQNNNVHCNPNDASFSSMLQDFVHASSGFEGVDYIRSHRPGSKRKNSVKVSKSDSSLSTSEGSDDRRNGQSYLTDESDTGFLEEKLDADASVENQSVNKKSLNMADMMQSLLSGFDTEPIQSQSTITDLQYGCDSVVAPTTAFRPLHHPSAIDSSSDEEFCELYGSDSLGKPPWWIDRKDYGDVDSVLLEAERSSCKQHVESRSRETSSNEKEYWVRYAKRMEDELLNQPANQGRFPQYHKSHGRSDRKKSRCSKPKAALAEPENTNTLFYSESGESLGSDPDSRDSDNERISDPLLERHISKNFLASILASNLDGSMRPPNGPASQLVASLNLPLNQISSALSNHCERPVNNNGGDTFSSH